MTRKMVILDATTNPYELLTAFLENFLYGAVANSITVFIAERKDIAVFTNFLLYYLLLSVIINREKYNTKLGKYFIFPGAATLGAFAGYKLAQLIGNLI